MRGFTIFVVTFGLLTVAGCSRSTPRSTVEAFLQAAQRGDKEAMKTHVTKNSTSLLEQTEIKPTEFTYEILSETVQDDRAQVEVKFHADEKTATVTSVLLREDGVWKIDLKETLAQFVSDIGNAIGKGMEELGKGLGKALEEMGKGLGKGLERGLNEMNRSMEKK